LASREKSLAKEDYCFRDIIIVA